MKTEKTKALDLTNSTPGNCPIDPSEQRPRGIITANQVRDIQNSGHAPGDPFESAIIADLPAGSYTAIVRGVNNTAGVGLVEVYDLDQ